MQKHGLSMCSNYTNMTFNDAVLPMCTNTAKGLRLVSKFDCFSKSLAVKNLIITVDMLNASTKMSCKSFQLNFRLKSSDRIGRFLEVTSEEMTYVITTNRGTGVATFAFSDIA
jgi:hypothetical protein